MINFRCPKCDDWLSVPDSSSGAKETCPSCGNVCIAPVPTASSATDYARRASQVSSRAPQKPKVPRIMVLGLKLYVASLVLGFISLGFHEQPAPEMDERIMPVLLILWCVSFVRIPVEILGIVMAWLGRAWAAVVIICNFGVGLSVALAIAAIDAPFPGVWPSILGVLAGLSYMVGVACFLLPSAWGYYEASAGYRKNRF